MRAGQSKVLFLSVCGGIGAAKEFRGYNSGQKPSLRRVTFDLPLSVVATEREFPGYGEVVESCRILHLAHRRGSVAGLINPLHRGDFHPVVVSLQVIDNGRLERVGVDRFARGYLAAADAAQPDDQREQQQANDDGPARESHIACRHAGILPSPDALGNGDGRKFVPNCSREPARGYKEQNPVQR